MSSETANRYFQGKENVPMAMARRRIKSGGDVKSALELIPISKPVYARYPRDGPVKIIPTSTLLAIDINKTRR